MKERPILFSAPMVRAILDGGKMQTRRIMKPQMEVVDVEGLFRSLAYPIKGNRKLLYPNAKQSIIDLCPHGKIGDQLWVREAFSVTGFNPSADNSTEAGSDWECAACRVRYHADGVERNVTELSSNGYIGVDEEQQALRASKKKTVPSIHMPRWASRINLEITGVRVERLNDISAWDAKQEGAEALHIANLTESELNLLDIPLAEPWEPYRNGFASLWESISGAGSWAANPWVWVIEFKVMKNGN